MTPQAFIAKWGKPEGVAGPAYALNEEQGAQSHFLDLRDLLGVAKPGSIEGYLFEEKNTPTASSRVPGWTRQTSRPCSNAP